MDGRNAKVRNHGNKAFCSCSLILAMNVRVSAIMTNLHPHNVMGSGSLLLIFLASFAIFPSQKMSWHFLRQVSGNVRNEV
jgi:hypothetical protein